MPSEYDDGRREGEPDWSRYIDARAREVHTPCDCPQTTKDQLVLKMDRPAAEALLAYFGKSWVEPGPPQELLDLIREWVRDE